MYSLNKESSKPLYIQLYEQMKSDIIENYSVGDKLPSVRKISSTYNISKTTIESAYGQLVAEGYIESYPNSGFRVENINELKFKTRNIITDANRDDFEKAEWLYDFYPSKLSKDSFPLKLWKRLFTKYIDESLDFGAYSNPQGEEGLREEIAKYLKNSRGVSCNKNQIIVGCGFSELMEIMARILKKIDINSFGIENPGYHIAKNVFENYGFKINKIPLDNDGIKIEELKKTDSKAVYLTPSHQYPTGVTIPISNRYKLLNWAKENDSFIIEDDYDTELNYINRPIPSLQGLDTQNRVIYIGTFSKSLCASLRVGYMVLPNSLMDIYYKFENKHSTVPIMTQKILEKFMSEGHWEKHLRKIRTINSKKHNLMKSELLSKLGDTVKIESFGGGLSIVINPKVPMDIEKLKSLAIKEKIKLYFAKDVSGGDWDAIRMGFGGFRQNEIKDAINAFSKIWFASLIG